MNGFGDPLSEIVRGIRSGNRRMLAKMITLVESALPEHQAKAQEILDELLPFTGNVVRLGISGVPGVGKSTFIESLGMLLIQQGKRVAVLAVDPSSTRSGGSILADKTRMEKLSVEPNAFIRPSPSGGTLGGVARKTRETMLICEAAGFDVIIVETVGVGQSEVAVASMVDFFLVLMLAGAGDEIQGIKKGILEMADAIAINKADGDNLERADLARKDYQNALRLLMPSSAVWQPSVLTCSAIEMKGIDTIWETVLDHRAKMMASGLLMQNRKKQAVAWLWSLIEEGLKERFHRHPLVQESLKACLAEVESGKTTPAAAATRLLDLLDRSR
ncbi:methylmalonyl Co-A mutase-associated GTPase MeaB [Desulfatirhabdium butyrativorans]|uniref:methylmalonyl Co-A mutase-associated GTPase MeaB n=1 Tax=Desulfatirhabdium butyrativorans TaxID=340467 RepID=UPI00040B3046|nr:methylmalonyl Co-A mutase-associated GTPase MeaB [Desulfatirhabdium butyrativorans]